ncbi:MAG: hypothetical protein AABX13_04835 [Nanoarchaeota archaeon]
MQIPTSIRQHKIRNTRKNLYEIILQLENVDARLENNTPYQLNAEKIGILYAHAVSICPVELSPGQHDPKTLRREVWLDYQKLFQNWSRNFMYARVGELVWRQSTAAQLVEKYWPPPFPDSYTPDTIESLVSILAQKTEFTAIGERLKAGALVYHQETRRRGMFNYRYAAEYEAILHALKQ